MALLQEVLDSRFGYPVASLMRSFPTDKTRKPPNNVELGSRGAIETLQY